VRITETDTGTLFVALTPTDPTKPITDIDGLFFNLSDSSTLGALNFFPESNTGSIFSPVTGVQAATDNVDTLSNGAQVSDTYDIAIQFGTTDSSTLDVVESANFTLFSDNGPLTLADLDLDSFAAVVDSDGGSGQVLTNGDAAGADPVFIETEVLFDNFDGHISDSDVVESNDGWRFAYDKLVSNGSNDGTVTFQEVATDGPVTLSMNLLTHSTTNLENSGAYADSLRIEVQIDGGDWVLLDEYAVNDAGTAVVGSETGQSFGTSGDDVTYSGGILDTATESVQFRAISDISANNEYFKIDDFSVTVTEEVAGGGTTTNTIVATESFDNIHEADQSDLIASDGHWNVSNGQLVTNGHADGTLQLATVQSEGPASVSFDASVNNLHNFEAGGRYGDELRVEVRLDNGTWETLDTFVINHDKSALVGSETGNEITQSSSNLSYTVDDANGAVDFRFVSDISAGNEIIRIDNLEVSTTEVVDGGAAAGQKVTVDFNDANSGDVVDGQFEGVTISAQRDGDRDTSENDAMIFDSNNPTGGDHDLEYDGQGNILIISEDNDSSDADDEAHGGTISFEFDAVSEVQSLNLLDIEEAGGTIDLFDADGTLINSVGIPAAGDNSNQVIEINTLGVSSMDVNLVGSGAVDDLMFVPEGDAKAGQYDVNYINGIPTLDPVADDQFKDLDAADDMDVFVFV
jgi:hypothetical protein